ncbi:MAG: hypothetical protein J5476_10285, partial [Lachnospiraceae bacterium]|nr:hypothetical protein [Lachnospiraceae bacterium]
SSAFEYQQNDNLYRVEFKDIPLDSLTTPLTVVFKNNTKDISATITYSCESYAKSILGGDYDANVKDLVKKMLAYGDSAKAYAATLPTGCVTYRQFGAMGNFVALEDNNIVDDYYAIVMTHDYANNKKLPVKADNAAHYYAAYMDPRTVDGGQIKTDTDWGNANFTINDRNLRIVTDADGKPSIPEPDRYCALFTVKSFQKSGYKWVITSNNNNNGIFLGLDPNLPDYPEYNKVDLDMAKNMTNKTLSAGQKKIPGNFRMKALYYLKTESYLRWGRNDQNIDKPRPQAEVFVVDKDGKVDSRGPIQWPWKDICTIKYYPIDDDTLTVKGGTFTTIVNDQSVRTYIRRGIVINRSNTIIEDVVHKHTGEEKKFPANYDHSTGKNASYGAPYEGFFRPEYCAYVTLKNCRFTDHYHVSAGTYDLDAEFVVGLTIDHCKCLPINMTGFQNVSSNYSDPTGIMDPLRWGTTGTNYCKDIKVINHSVISRLDAHKGAYGFTVKDSTLGQRGVAAIGFGDLVIENSRILSENFISLRQDFGSFWDGKIYIKNCTWRVDNPSRGLIRIAYDPTFDVGYEPMYDQKGNRCYSTLPSNVYIDGLTIDATNLDVKNGYSFYTRGLNIFDSVIKNTGITSWTQVIDEDYINRTNAPTYEEYKATKKSEAIAKWGYPYYFPIRPTESVTVTKDKVHVIRRDADIHRTKTLNGIWLRNKNIPQIIDAYFFEQSTNPDEYVTHLNLTSGEVSYSISDPINIMTYLEWKDDEE